MLQENAQIADKIGEPQLKLQNANLLIQDREIWRVPVLPRDSKSYSRLNDHLDLILNL